MNTHALCCSLVAALLAACSSAPSPAEQDEDVEARLRRDEARTKELKEKRHYAPKVLMELDQAMAKYFEARGAGADKRAERLAETLDKFLRRRTRENFDLLVHFADDPADWQNRGIALVALGFTDESVEERKLRERNGTRLPRDFADAALDPLVTALGDEREHIVNQALHGLGLLGAENTPIARIGEILESDHSSAVLRTSAAWALMTIQPELTVPKRAQIRPIYQRVLMQPVGKVEPEVLDACLRGLGWFRQPEDSVLAVPYLEHPVPLVRVRASIALGMMGDESVYPRLLELIKPVETNENVRLAARTALKTLAGGIDRKYEVADWITLFERK